MCYNPFDSRAGNFLISALPLDVRQNIEAHLEAVDLPKGKILTEEGESITHVYFPGDAIVSLAPMMESGDVVDAATVGREGMVGYVAALGSDRASTRDVVRVPGVATRIERGQLQVQLRNSERLQQHLLCYVEAFSIQLVQSVACTALHSIEERFCRCLLTIRDQAGRDAIPLTQEDLADMLGVRRSSVNRVAQALQTAGLIRYRRGTITVADRAGLQDGACECYGVVRRHCERLLRITCG